jgi:hypothetical protein
MRAIYAMQGIRGPGPDYDIDPRYWVVVMAKFAFVLMFEVRFTIIERFLLLLFLSYLRSSV